MGRHSLVFCCDESFDYQAITRIFVGLCNVGAWGCFDEFNRLEESIMSAVSQQIQAIQQSVRTKNPLILANHNVSINRRVGIFITMNPGYAGRCELPDNLKSLFRGVPMSVPDRSLIAEVLMSIQGFTNAGTLAPKMVQFFDLCCEQLSRQSHYDFGLRALKNAVTAAGVLMQHHSKLLADSKTLEVSTVHESIQRTVFPKLTMADSILAEK